MKREIVYIYALINPIDSQVFYIGATVNSDDRLSQHINSRNNSGTTKERLIYELYENSIEPELLIIDTVLIKEAAYWEDFYISLFKSYGFVLLQHKISYPSRKLEYPYHPPYQPYKKQFIDGKDIHFYRREVLKKLKFFEHIKFQQ